MNIDYRLNLAISKLEDTANHHDGSLIVIEAGIEEALVLLREIKGDLHRAPDPRQTAFPLR